LSNVKLQTDEDLILLNYEAGDRHQVLQELCNRVLAKGYITDQFFEKLLRREEEFPTGLEMAYPIAIPHVGGNCWQSFLALAVMRKPVAFNAMDGTGKELPVSLVFMFGITNPSEQVDVLKRFIISFREEKNLKELMEQRDEKAVVAFMSRLLGEGLEVNCTGRDACCS
jgi:PTS system galactitol-specific IIA component